MTLNVHWNDQRTRPTHRSDEHIFLIYSFPEKNSLFFFLLLSGSLSLSFIRPTAAQVHLWFTASAKLLKLSWVCDECLNFLTLSYLHPAWTARSQTQVKFTHERLNTRVTQKSHLHSRSLKHTSYQIPNIQVTRKSINAQVRNFTYIQSNGHGRNFTCKWQTSHMGVKFTPNRPFGSVQFNSVWFI